MNYLSKKLMLSGLCLMGLQAHDGHHAAVKGVQASPLCVEVADGSRVPLTASQIQKLDSELVSGLLEFHDDESVVPLRRFGSVAAFEQFMQKVDEPVYAGESAEEAKAFVKDADFLLVPQEKIDTYIRSVAADNKLLLARLYRALHKEGRDFIIDSAVRQLTPFVQHERLGVVDRDPARVHLGIITSCVVLDPDTVVTGSCDHTAIIWHRNGEGVWQLQQRLGVIDNTDVARGHMSSINSCVVLDHDTIVTGSDDRTAIVWHRNGEGVWQLQQRLGVVFNNVDPARGHMSSINSCVVLDHDTIVTGSDDRTAIVWHRNGEGVWQLQQRLGVVFNNVDPARGHTHDITSCAVLDPDTIVTGSWDSTAIIWHRDAEGVWQLQQRLGVVFNRDPDRGHAAPITSCAVLDSDTFVTGSRDRTVILWHRNAEGVWQLQQRLGVVENSDPDRGHTHIITSCVVLDHETIVTGSRDRTAIIWHRNGEGVWQLQQRLGVIDNWDPAGHTEFISSCAVLDPDTIVTGSCGRAAIIWRRDAHSYFEAQLPVEEQVEVNTHVEKPIQVQEQPVLPVRDDIDLLAETIGLIAAESSCSII